MGHTFSPEEKEQLLTQGNLGKTVELSPKSGEPFRVYVSVDRLTNELVSLRADRVQIPHEIKGVRLSEEQHRALTEGPLRARGGHAFASRKTVRRHAASERRKARHRIHFQGLPVQ